MQITVNEYQEYRAAGGEAVLLDVRTLEEFEIVRLEGALLVTRDLLKEILEDWPRDRALITYCHHGVRSLEAAKFLASRGFGNVRSLSGGIDAWATDIDPSLPRY